MVAFDTVYAAIHHLDAGTAFDEICTKSKPADPGDPRRMVYGKDAAIDPDVGIDLEAPLVERATAAARRRGLDHRCRFQVVEPGPFPFPDNGFDIVLSSGAVTQTTDTAGIIADCYRVLKPGGYFTTYEWMRIDETYCEEMLRWFRLVELTYVLETIESFAQLFRDAGFVDVETTDASNWYRRECRREYELIRGDLYPHMVELLGLEDADHFVENWQAMTVVCESGEMRQAYCRGRRRA